MSEELKSNEAERELSPELVKEVEDSFFGSVISDPRGGTVDKINILLVASGLKPASDLRMVVREEDGMNGGMIELSDEEINSNLVILDKLGLFHAEKRRIEKSKWKKGAKKRVTENEEMEILIGHTQADLDNLIKAWDTKDDRAKGHALGFSPTAVEAYCRNEKPLDVSILPDEVVLSEVMAFNPGVLSTDHWREELEYYGKWSDYVKKVSPNLHNTLTSIKPL